MFKILTSAIKSRMYDYLVKNKIFVKIVVKKSSGGCKDQLLLNMAIIQSAEKKKRKNYK